MDSPLATTIGARFSAYLTSADEYHKYRKRVNKSLLKLRHELDLVTRDTKNYKTKERTSKLTAEDYAKNDKYGLVLLLTAERDLLHSLEIKSLLEISNESASSYKNLMVSKLKRSVHGTKKLLEVTANEKDDTRAIELYTYAALNEGSYAINKRRWEAALNAFSIAKCALEYLASQSESRMAVDDGEDISHVNKTLINEIFVTVIDPSLTLAVSQIDSLDAHSSDLRTISRKHCHDTTLPYLQTLVKLIEKNDPSFVSEIASSVKLIDSITWRNHEASLYNDELAFKIMNLTDDQVLGYTEIGQFDGLLSGWAEALELHKSDLDKNKDEDDNDKIQNRAITLTFINYHLLFTKIRRDSMIVNQLIKESETGSRTVKLNNNRDINRLYESIINTIEELKELPGVFNDDDLSVSLENMQKYFEALKHIRLADSFTLNEKYPEALKIVNHLDEQLPESSHFYPVEDFPYSVTSNQKYVDFRQEIKSSLNRAHGLAQFAHEINSKTSPSQFTIENMQKFPLSLDSLVNLGSHATIEAVSNKPVLFDIAFNYINYSSPQNAVSESKPESSASNEDDKKKSGFLGFFGRG